MTANPNEGMLKDGDKTYGILVGLVDGQLSIGGVSTFRRFPADTKKLAGAKEGWRVYFDEAGEIVSCSAPPNISITTPSQASGSNRLQEKSVKDML